MVEVVAVAGSLRAASSRKTSGDRGSGGEDGGVVTAPSSWAKAGTATFPGVLSLRLLAALVSLGEGIRLPMWAAAAEGVAAAGPQVVAAFAAAWA